METMQLCQLPQLPINGISKPGYIHTLSGKQMQTSLTIGVLELDSGSHTALTLDEESLVTVYIETSEYIPVALEISETGGMRTAVAVSMDQDRS